MFMLQSLFTLLAKKRTKIIGLLNEEATGNNENDQSSSEQNKSSQQGGQDLVSTI